MDCLRVEEMSNNTYLFGGDLCIKIADLLLLVFRLGQKLLIEKLGSLHVILESSYNRLQGHDLFVLWKVIHVLDRKCFITTSH